MTQSTEQERAEFEAWWKDCELNDSCSKKSVAVKIFAFEVWQAARRAQVVPKCSECEDTGVGVSHGYDCSSCYGELPAAPVQMPEPEADQQRHP